MVILCLRGILVIFFRFRGYLVIFSFRGYFGNFLDLDEYFSHFLGLGCILAILKDFRSTLVIFKF